MASDTTPKTILLSGHGIQREAIAAGAITPGMLIARNSDGEVAAHSVAGGLAQLSFAKEYDLTGKTIDDAYAADDQVVYEIVAPGSHVYALLATGEEVQTGDFLVSKGTGALAALDDAVGGVVIAQALEDVDNDPGTALARIRVEIMPATFVAAAS